MESVGLLLAAGLREPGLGRTPTTWVRRAKRSARRHSATRINLILSPVVLCSGVLDAQQFDRQDVSTRSSRACATATERDAAFSQSWCAKTCCS